MAKRSAAMSEPFAKTHARALGLGMTEFVRSLLIRGWKVCPNETKWRRQYHSGDVACSVGPLYGEEAGIGRLSLGFAVGVLS